MHAGQCALSTTCRRWSSFKNNDSLIFASLQEIAFKVAFKRTAFIVELQEHNDFN